MTPHKLNDDHSHQHVQHDVSCQLLVLLFQPSEGCLHIQLQMYPISGLGSMEGTVTLGSNPFIPTMVLLGSCIVG